MKNEDRVLSILEQMQGNIAKIQGDVTKIQDDIIELKENQLDLQGDIASLKTGQLDLQEQINLLKAHTTKEHELTRSELKAEIDYVYKELKEDMNMIEMVVAKKWYNTTKEEVMKEIRVME